VNKVHVHVRVGGTVEGHPDLDKVPNDITDPEKQVMAGRNLHLAKFK